MADNVIKSFLVSLGFQVEGQDKFDKGLMLSTAKAVALGEAMYDLAKTVAETVAAMATGLDQLYWQTQRLGSSAQDIKALQYAFQQLGGSASDVNSILGSIANFTFSYGQGAQSFLTRLGVDPQHLGNAAATFHDLEVIFQRMVAQGGPNATARTSAFASVLGISPDQLRVMLRDTGEFEQKYGEFAAKLGLNLTEAADKSNQFMTDMRLLKADVGLLFDVGVSDVLTKILPYLDRFAEWVNDLTSGHKLTGLGGTLQSIFEAIGNLVSALGELASSPAIQQFAETFGQAMADAISSLAHLIRMANFLVNGDWDQANAEAEAALVAGANSIMHGMDAAAGLALGGFSDNRFGTKGTSDWDDNGPTPSGAPSGPSGGGGDRYNQAVSILQSQGLPQGAARGAAAAMYAESGLDPQAQGQANARTGHRAQGIAQWLTPQRIAEIQGHFHKSIRSMSLAEQLQAFVWEMGSNPAFARLNAAMRSGQMDEMGAARAVIDIFESPGSRGARGDMLRASRVLGAHGASITQTNNYTIHGGNAQETARAVAVQQEHSNQRLFANLAPAAQ